MTRAVVKKRKRAPHLAGEHEFNDEEDDGGENDDDPSTGGASSLRLARACMEKDELDEEFHGAMFYRAM